MKIIHVFSAHLFVYLSPLFLIVISCFAIDYEIATETFQLKQSKHCCDFIVNATTQQKLALTETKISELVGKRKLNYVRSDIFVFFINKRKKELRKIPYLAVRFHILFVTLLLFFIKQKFKIQCALPT